MKSPMILVACLTIFGCDDPDSMLSIDPGEDASGYDSGTKGVPIDAGAERHLQPCRSDTGEGVYLEGTATADYDTGEEDTGDSFKWPSATPSAPSDTGSAKACFQVSPAVIAWALSL